MKKSVEILGLPVISITEGRELGLSKSLLIDTKNGLVAAITIEDDDWYRGVKLIPYESVIAIGSDAVTITHSENILKLEDAGDYENLLDENIRVIGTKAITKNGIIQGTVTEIYIGDDGRIEKCEITSPDGSVIEVTADQIAIFGKQVTVIDAELEKKTELVDDRDDYYAPTRFDAVEDVRDVQIDSATPPSEPAFQPPSEDVAVSFEQPEPAPIPEPIVEPEPIVPPVSELPAEPEPAPVELEAMMEPEPVVEPTPEPVVEPTPEPVVEPTPEPVVEPIPEPVVEPIPEPVVESTPEPVVESTPEPIVKTEPEPVVEPIPEPVVESMPEPVVEPTPDPVIKTKPEPIPEPKPAPSGGSHETQQAKRLKAALAAAMAKQSRNKPAAKNVPSDEQLLNKRAMFIGKHATKTIRTDGGIVIVEEGAEVTDAVYQKARLATKLGELAQSIQ